MIFTWLKGFIVGESNVGPNEESSQRMNIDIASFSRGAFDIDIVGESHYFIALNRAKEGAEIDGSRRVITTVLVPDPNNKFDKNAIQVCAVVNEQMEQIGHLSRGRALDYRRAIELWQSKGYFMSCKAALFGGEGRKANIGVWLDLPDPEEVENDYHEQFSDT